jgi:hypothetical protein
VGLWRLLFARLRLFYLLISMTLAYLAFYIHYAALDVDVFFIPVYWAMAHAVALGLSGVSVAVRGAIGVRVPMGSPQAVEAQRAATTFGFRLAGWGPGLPAAWLPTLVVSTLVLAAAASDWRTGFALNDQSGNVSFRDFYANALPALPVGSYFYHRGGAMGHDILYYTRVYGVRPDLHVQVGKVPGEPRLQPWPPGPAYSGVHKYDWFLPSFIDDPLADNTKWYDPQMYGMFRWRGTVQFGWLSLYKIRHLPPPKWVVESGSRLAKPEQPVGAKITPDLTLLGVTADPQVQRGRPWHITRYWRSTTAWMPNLATVLGNNLAVEVHVPLNRQLGEYLRERNIDEDDLGNYVIREDLHLVVPSNTPIGKHQVTVTRIRPRLYSNIISPVSPSDVLLLETQAVIASVEVTEARGEALADPVTLGDALEPHYGGSR